MNRRLGLLITGSLAAWVVTLYPAYRLWGNPDAYGPWWQDPVFVYSAVAVGLCLVPTALTLVWGGWAFRQSPEQQLLMVLGGTVVRILVVLGGGVALFLATDYFRQKSFMVWLLVFYLLTLALEIVLLTGQTSAADGGLDRASGPEAERGPVQ